MRVIVWGCHDIPNVDFEDASDLYVTCTFNGDTQETDTHYRCLTGDATFNWRMVFPMQLPIKDKTISFRVYDKDIFSYNDFISSGTFSLERYLEEAFENEVGVKLYLGDEDLSEYSDVTYSSSKLIDGVRMYDRFEVDLVNRTEESVNIS